MSATILGKEVRKILLGTLLPGEKEGREGGKEGEEGGCMCRIFKENGRDLVSLDVWEVQ